MEHKSGCLICGEALTYSEQTAALRCFYCGAAESAGAVCVNAHYVCDACHSGSANDLIQRYCSMTVSIAPMEMANTLMRSSVVKMHGPEHHFLVPAVLLAAYCNRLGTDATDTAEKIQTARRGAEDISVKIASRDAPVFLAWQSGRLRGAQTSQENLYATSGH